MPGNSGTGAMNRAGGNSVVGNGAAHPPSAVADIAESAASNAANSDRRIENVEAELIDRAPLRAIDRDARAGDPARARRRQHHDRIRNFVGAAESSRGKIVADEILLERRVSLEHRVPDSAF